MHRQARLQLAPGNLLQGAQQLLQHPQPTPHRPADGPQAQAERDGEQRQELLQGIADFVDFVARVHADAHAAAVGQAQFFSAGLGARIQPVRQPALQGAALRFVGRLIEAVAKRMTILARARMMARESDWKHLDEQLKQLDEQPGVPQFQAQLAAIRVPAIRDAQSRKDRRSEIRIEKLCKEVSDLIDRYLGDEKTKLIREEIDELRAAAD